MMLFPHSSQSFGVHYVSHCGSTNTLLRQMLEEKRACAWSVVVTDDQRQGRGRQGRNWVCPPKTALAISACVPVHMWRLPKSWLPLLVAEACRFALTKLCAADELCFALKWPNDVLLADAKPQKVSGILCEHFSEEHAIIGVGVNVLADPAALESDRASSLRVLAPSFALFHTFEEPQAAQIADRFLSLLLNRMRKLCTLAETNPQEVKQEIADHMQTLGTLVRVHLVGDEKLCGRAKGLGDEGELLIETAEGCVKAVFAGDVEHLREAQYDFCKGEV